MNSCKNRIIITMEKVDGKPNFIYDDENSRFSAQFQEVIIGEVKEVLNKFAKSEKDDGGKE